MANFIRTKHYAYAALGKRQKSKRKYRRPTGRHNKMRQKWKGRTPMVEIGYKNECSERGKIEGKIPIRITNLNELRNANAKNIIILANIGAKSKIDIAKEIISRKLECQNFKAVKFLKQMERKNAKLK